MRNLQLRSARQLRNRSSSSVLAGRTYKMVEPSAAMPEMSFPKAPRSGQRSVIEECRNRLLLNVKLPTGYGKTLAACYVYSVKKFQGLANRLLWIFPTDAQLDQFYRDGRKDLADAGIHGHLKV